MGEKFRYKTIKEVIEELSKYPDKSTIELYLAEDEGLIIFDKDHKEIGFVRNHNGRECNPDL